MHSIDIKEKKLLQEWAAANRDEQVFEQRSSSSMDSYFLTRNNEETYIMPYKFKTIPEFQERITEVWRGGPAEIDPQRQKLLAIAAFKCRAVAEEKPHEEQKKENTNKGKLPEFTYAF